MSPWLLLLLLLSSAAAVLLVQRLRRRRAPRLPAERTLFDLGVGDIVQLDGRDWVVEDCLRYEETDFQWLEYLLRDGAEGRWLCVEEDDWLVVSWLEPAPAALTRQLQTLDDPLPDTLEWEGIRYELRERGRALLTASARSLNRRVGRCRYGDYEGPGQRVLSVEVWDEAEADPADLEVTLGRRVDPALLALLPGDGRSVYR